MFSQMQIEESAVQNDGASGDGARKRNDSSLTIQSSDDEIDHEIRPSGRFTKRNYRKRSNSSGSSSPIQPDYTEHVTASNTNATTRNADNAEVVGGANAPEDTHSSDDEHSNSVVGMYGMTTDSNSSSSSSSGSDSNDTSGDELMSEECSSDSNVSEETENKSNIALNRPMPKWVRISLAQRTLLVAFIESRAFPSFFFLFVFLLQMRFEPLA